MLRIPSGDGRMDLPPHVIDVDMEGVQDSRSHSVLLADQPEQDVLRPHILMVEPSRFLAGRHEHLPHTLGEAVAGHWDAAWSFPIVAFRFPREEHSASRWRSSLGEAGHFGVTAALYQLD